MVNKKINIISSSIIINEGLKSLIQQLTANQLIEDYIDWYDFLENFDSTVPDQTVFIEIHCLPEKEKLKHVKEIVSDSVTVILLYSNSNEVKKFNDFVSIPLNISKEDIIKKLSDYLFNGENKEPENNVLSEREITILKEVALGLTNKEISEKLYISMHTVITHRKNITAKLGIKTISGLTVYALINNVISPTDLNQSINLS